MSPPVRAAMLGPDFRGLKRGAYAKQVATGGLLLGGAGSPPIGRDRAAEGMRGCGGREEADDGRIRNDKGGDLERVGALRAMGGTLAGHSGRTASARSGRHRTPRNLAGRGAYAGPVVGR